MWMKEKWLREGDKRTVRARSTASLNSVKMGTRWHASLPSRSLARFQNRAHSLDGDKKQCVLSEAVPEAALTGIITNAWKVRRRCRFAGADWKHRDECLS